MAKARDPVLEELRRSASLSASTSRKTELGLMAADSTLSLEGMEQADIDALVNRRWQLDEIIGLVRSRMAILSGGRDRRGAPIITIHGSEHSDFRPSNLAKLLSYLSKVADERLQGLGFTIILDMRQTSWSVMKKALKSLQLTFVEHVHQVLLVKPRAFWQRQKAGVSFTLKKAKFNYPITTVESTTDLFHYLQASQVTRELSGTLSYNHDKWIDVQRSLERHTISLEQRLEEFEILREQFGNLERLDNLNEARDAVRRHVEAKQRLDKTDLDIICETVGHTIAKLQPCDNADFQACFVRLEDHCNSLQTSRGQLERLWEEKGTQLDKVLQLRVFEHDAEQVSKWIVHEGNSLAREHTDIGDTSTAAEMRRQSFEDFRNRLKLKHQELSRVCTMGERLTAANHYAADVFRYYNKELKGRWENLVQMADERAMLLSLSVSFHEDQQKFLQNVENWIDECMLKDFPADMESAERLQAKHKQLKDTYQELYVSARQDGHKIIERLKKPVGESSLPTAFVIGTRHVKEILESLFDERNWLDEQWQRRNVILTQALNLRKYQNEAKKVYTWISDVGNPFLTSSNSIGSDASQAEGLLRHHDQFEGEANDIYQLASQLFAEAKELSTSGECNPDMIEEAAESLESAVNTFASRLDERREIILHSEDYHKKMKHLTVALHDVGAPLPRDKFEGTAADIEPHLSAFLSSWSKVRCEFSEACSCCQELVKRLGDASKSAESAGSSVDYTTAEESIHQYLEEVKMVEQKVRELCLKRERRWNLSIQLEQLGPRVDKYLIELESWTQEQENVEWEPADNTMDAQLHLDAFKRQYDQLITSHDELVAMGRNVSKDTEQLDSEMFGMTASGPAHPVTYKIEKLLEKMELSSSKMLKVARPKLDQFQDCLQFHLLQQRANKLTMALTSLNISISNLCGVGHTLDEARSLNQQASEITSQLQGVGDDVDGFSHEVDDCVARQHYESTRLAKLARSLQERKGRVSKCVTERHRVISASMKFQQNVKNLSASIDNCQAQFSSKEAGSSVADTERRLKNQEELKTSVEQAAEEVQSLGHKLLELILESPTPCKVKTSSPWLSPAMSEARKPRVVNGVTTLNRTPRSRKRILSSSSEVANSPVPSRSKTAESAKSTISNGLTFEVDLRFAGSGKPMARANSLEMLDSNSSDSVTDDTDNPTSSKLACPGSPRLLVTPKKAAGIKSAHSMPSVVPPNPDQLMIEGVLQQMGERLEQLKEMWGKRQRLLKQSLKMVEYREAVPEVIEWVELVGNEFIRGRSNLGRSIEEVKGLIVEGEEFKRDKMSVISEKVDHLQSMYSAVERGGGHGSLNEVREINTALMNTWKDFNKSFESLMTNLQQSLKFQETLFEASNWCQKSQVFLNSMEERGDVCDCSTEAASLLAELSAFVNATMEEQMERVNQLKQLSDCLRSNRLCEVAQHISLSSEQTVNEFESTKVNLESLCKKLVQIEGEKDRERRLTKQRERVIEEIVNTEETYTTDLKVIVEKCRPRFVSNQLPPSLKGKESIIFANIADIEAFHRTHMLPRLQGLDGDVNGVAEVFIEYADQLAELYVPFCRDKPGADDLLTSHRSYFDRIQFMFGTATPLHSLLIKPVQRIAKYPLLMKEALKYTTELNQASNKLEEAVKAVEKILTVTNNAIHISYLDKSKDLVKGLGQLLYQSPLLVSEQSRFGIKAEKERHVFAFDRALLFARKVELGQGAKFKYEHKFSVPLNAGVKVVEFIEGEPCKFILSSGDHRIHFKALSLDVKQDWITALRTAILEESSTLTKNKSKNGSMATLTVEQPRPLQGGVIENGWDIRDTSPSPSFNELSTAAEKSPLFEQYRVTEDYHSSSEPLHFSLSRGDLVEVLDNKMDGKWYVRSLKGSGHGWIPASLLEHAHLGGKEDTDGKGQWVQIASGPLNQSSISEDDKRFHAKPSQTSFGSRDVQSQNVIHALKKVTFEDQGEGMMNGIVEVMDDDDDEEMTSLDRPLPLSKRDRTQSFPTSLPGSSTLDVAPLANHSISPRGSPFASPRVSPRTSPRASPRVERRHTELTAQNSIGSGSEKSPTHQWTKKEWRRKVIRKRQGSTCRNNSISSERSLSPSEKMLQSSSSDEAINIKTEKLSEEEESATASSRTSVEVEEEELEKVKKAQLKIKFIMNELVETERQYVKQLKECIDAFITEMQSPSLPEQLKGKEKLVFGNIQAIYEFHNNTFFHLVEEAKDSVSAMGQCFLDQASGFEVYVPYCENKPKSESFLWTYGHHGGTFFNEVQNSHNLRQGIDSYLIKPVQRITKYQLLLRDLKKSGEKAAMETGGLEKALELMQDIPKRANDAMALSMIFGYEGNIHANGRIILQDEFTVYERSRWTAARRHLFLLDQRLMITKEKDSDGMYVYKDSLKVHSLSVAEKEGDNPCRFAVGTGSIGTIDTWDQYYILEASSPEKKRQWVDAIKDILKGQFELLKGLKAGAGTPGQRPRSRTFDSISSYTLESSSAAMINLSDDSENEEEEVVPTPKSSRKGSAPVQWPSAMPPSGAAPQRHQTIAEPTPHQPLIQSRSFNLYVVAEDCAPPKDNEGILFVHKGQIYDVIESKSDWWWARLVRDLTASAELCQQGWVPGSFLEKYGGSLTTDEQSKINTIIRKKKLLKQALNLLGSADSAMPNGSAIGGKHQPAKRKSSVKNSQNKAEKNKLKITSSLTFQDLQGEADDELQGSQTLPKQKAPRIVMPLSDETVIAGRAVQLKCQMNRDAYPTPVVEWSKDGEPLNIDRAFTSIGEESCVLRIKMVESSDEGCYTCTMTNKKGMASSSAKVTVMSPPDPPSKPAAQPLTSTSVSLSWTPPTFTGHSPITIYLVQCKDTISDRWSTIMKRITEPSTLVDDLMPGAEYVFRVVANNNIGSSDPSFDSKPILMPRSPLDTEFSFDPFDSHYDLLDEIGKGRYGTVYECVHNTTQQIYAAKLLPLSISHAHHELKMLSRLSHPNIVQLTSAYKTPDHYVLLFPLIQGVNLFEYFTYRDCLSESSAAGCLEQVVSALCYLHQSNIAHLDIKPENVLTFEVIDSAVPEVKLIHFERSREVSSDTDLVISRLDDHIEYEAPEILLGQPVSTATDMWSLGVVLYTLLGGTSPFLVDSLDLTKDNIVNVRYSFPVKAFREVSEEAKDLLTQLLVKDKSNRLSALQCLRHSWMDSKLHTNKSSITLNISRLKSYVSSRKWQSSLFLEQSQL